MPNRSADAAALPRTPRPTPASSPRKRYLAWRRRLLPLGAAIAASCCCGGRRSCSSTIKPFIAPSPVRGGADVLVERFGMLMTNLLPTAIEAVCGFLLGNIAAISLATVFVYARRWRRRCSRSR